MNSLFKYGPPPLILQSSSRTSKNNEVIATSIPADLVSQVLNDSINSGDVNFDNVDIDLDNVSGSNTNISNISINTINSFQNAFVRVLSDIRFENKVVLSNSSLFDDNLMRIDGDVFFNGTNAGINSDQVIIKDNVVGIGVSSSSIDNFINGFYFPKRDNFSSFGLSVDKVGILSIPSGTFTANLFNVQSSNNKRFEDNRTSVRFTYISSDYNFDVNKNSEDKFVQNEISFINSLNNTDNEISNFYISIESHNLTLHGGNLITGISKDLTIYLTSANNDEIEYLKLELESDSFNILKNVKLDRTSFNFINNGNVKFTSDLNNTKKEILNINNSDNNITIHRDLRLIQNSESNNINIYFGVNEIDETKNTDLIIYHETSNTTTEMVKIDKANNNTNIQTSLHITGPKSGNKDKSMHPSFTMNNSLDTISTLTPISKSYIMSKELNANSETNTLFLEILTNNSKDCMVSGYIMISNATSTSNSSSHFYYRIEGMLSNGMTNPIFNGFVLSKLNLEIKNVKANSPIYFEYDFDYTNKSFKIITANNTADTLRMLVKLEIISL